jgi:hypothetical protein
VSIKGWDDFEMIWPGETRGKAKANAWIDCYTSGWNYPFTDFRAVRAPEFDSDAQATIGKYAWCLGWYDSGKCWGVWKPQRAEILSRQKGE